MKDFMRFIDETGRFRESHGVLHSAFKGEEEEDEDGL